MARTETDQLVVQLEARVRDFEKGMQRASTVANDNYRKMRTGAQRAGADMEKSLTASAGRINAALSKIGLGGLVGGLAAGGIAGIVSQFGDVAHSIAEIGDKAKQAGLDAKSFQELGFVASQNRIEVDSLTAGIREMQIRMSEFVTSAGKSGTAAQSLTALGYTVEDISTKLRKPNELFAELIGKVQGLDRASQIRIFDDIFGGDGERFVRLIDQGEAGIRATIQAANDLGVVLDDDVIERAAELDRQFNIVATTVGTALKTAIVEAATELQKFIDSFQAFDQRATATLKDRFGELQTRYGQLVKQRGTTEDDLLSYIGKDANTEIEAVKAEMDQVAAELRKRATPMLREKMAQANPVTMPAAPSTSSGGGRAAGAKSARTERDAVADLIAKLEEEKSLIGATDLERETANALRQAGAKATDDQKAKIITLVAAIHAEREATEKASEAAQELRDIGRDVLGGIISDLREGKSAGEIFAGVLDKLADKLANLALDSLFSAKPGGALIGGTFTLGRAA